MWCKTVLDDKRRKTCIVDHCQDGNRCQDRDLNQNGNEHADDQV